MLKDDLGVVYVAWGDKGIAEAKESARSCQRFGLSTCLVTDANTTVPDSCFDIVTVADFGDENGNVPYSRKMYAYRESPFEKTLYLDSDCLMLFDPHQWFDFDRYHLAVAHAPYPYFQWQRKHIIHFNTGVQFFVKCPEVDAFMLRWLELADNFKTEFQKDQYGFSLAVHQCRLRLLTLPYTCNYRAGLPGVTKCIQGPLYFWHSRLPVPKEVARYNAQFDDDRLNFKYMILEG